MSFLDVKHHEAHGHSDYLVYNLLYGSGHGPPVTAVLCLACFLDSLADADGLNTRKAYVLRQLTDILAVPPAPLGIVGGDDPSGCGRGRTALVRDIAQQHASLLVSALVDLLTWCTDRALEEDLRGLCITLCTATGPGCCRGGGSNFLPEMLVTRCAAALEEIFAAEPPQLPAQAMGALWGSSHGSGTHLGGSAHAPQAPGPSPAPLLRLLADLTHSLPSTDRDTATGALVRALAASPLLLRGLDEAIGGCGGGAGSGIGGGGQGAGALVVPSGGAGGPQALVALAGQPLFERCAVLLGRTAAGEASVTQRALCLDLLTALAERSCLLEQINGSGGMDLAASSHLASLLVAGLKPCLLDSSRPQVQATACRLLGIVAGRSHPRLVQQLIHRDMAEYLFEVLRSAAAAAAVAAAEHVGGGDGSAMDSASGVLVGRTPAASREQAAASLAAAAGELTSAAVLALSYLALEGPMFRSRLPFGVEVLTELCSAAATSCDHALAAELTELLRLAVAPPAPREASPSFGDGGEEGMGGGPEGCGHTGRLPLADVRRIIAAVEPLFPRAGAAAGGEVLVAAGVEGTAELSEAHAASCRGACEVLRGVCGWTARAPAHQSSALQGPLMGAVASALRGLSVVASASLGPGPGGYLMAACQLAVDAAVVLPSLASAGDGTGAAYQANPGMTVDGCGGAGAHPAGSGDPKSLQSRHLTAEMLRMWEVWMLPSLDRWHNETRALGADPVQLLPVITRALQAAAVPMAAALLGPRIPGPEAAAANGTYPGALPSDDPAAAAAMALAERLLAGGWVQFCFEVLTAAAAVGRGADQAHGEGSAAQGELSAAKAQSAEAGLTVWRLLMLVSVACTDEAHGRANTGVGADAEVAAVGGLQALGRSQELYETMAALMSGFESVAHVLEFLATGGAEQVAAQAVASDQAPAAGVAFESFMRLLRCALTAGDMGWAVGSGSGDLEWLLAALVHVLAEPAVQRCWPNAWWQCLHLYREVEARVAMERGALALPPQLLQPLEHMILSHPAPHAPGNVTLAASWSALGGVGAGVAAPLSRVELPLSVWAMQHADQLPSIVAAALPAWLVVDESRGQVDLEWAPQEVLDIAAGVAASAVSIPILARLLQRCAEAGAGGVGPTAWSRGGGSGDSLLDVNGAQAAALLRVRLLQLLTTCLGVRPQLVAQALDTALVASTRRLLLDLATPAGQGDTWAAASVIWVLQLLTQLLLAATAVCGSEGGCSDQGALSSPWVVDLLSEVSQQLGRAAPKLLVTLGASQEAARGAVGNPAHDNARMMTAGSTLLAKLQAVCFDAVALGLALDVAFNCHLPASAVLAQSEAVQGAARRAVARAADGTVGAAETCPPALLLLAMSALHGCAHCGGADAPSGLCADAMGASAGVQRPDAAHSARLLEDLLLVATSAAAPVARNLALQCLWLRLALLPGEVERLISPAGDACHAADGVAAKEAGGDPRLGRSQRLELLSCTFSNAACDDMACGRAPALLGLAALSSACVVREDQRGECGPGGAARLERMLPWARVILRQAVSRVCGCHAANSGVRAFVFSGSSAGDSTDVGPPMHREALTALQLLPDLALLRALLAVSSTVTTVTEFQNANLGEASSTGAPSHAGAAGGGGSSSPLGWVLAELRAAAADNLLVQALLQPPHPALQPLANEVFTGMVRQGLLEPATLSRARSAVASRIWRLQQQEGGGVAAASCVFGGTVAMQHVLRLSAEVEPAAAVMERAVEACGPSVPLCSSDTYRSWVLTAIQLVVANRTWQRDEIQGHDWLRGRNAMQGGMLKDIFTGIDDQALLGCMDEQLRFIVA